MFINLTYASSRAINCWNILMAYSIWTFNLLEYYSLIYFSNRSNQIWNVCSSLYFVTLTRFFILRACSHVAFFLLAFAFFRIEWVLQVSMELFRCCVFASLQFSYLCIIATEWRWSPFCVLAIAFSVSVLTGLNKKTSFQLLVVQHFLFPKCHLLLSEFSEIIKEMMFRPIQHNRHINEHAMLAVRRQRRFFFVFMFW